MKHTNFERVEKVQGDLRTEEVIVHRKKRYGHWKLKVWSVVLAFLIWLVTANVYEVRNASAGEQAFVAPMVEQTIL